MSQIVFQFVGGSALSSRLIELKGGGAYSHVDCVLDTGELLGARDDRVGGQESGVHIRPANYEEWESIARVSVDVSARQLNSYLSFIMSQLGKPYDQTAIAGFVFNRSWQEDDAWFCSELAITAAEKSGVFRFKPAVPSNKVDPCMAFALLSTVGTVSIIKSP